MEPILTLEQVYALAADDRARYIAEAIHTLPPYEAFTHLLYQDMNEDERQAQKDWEAEVGEVATMADVNRRSRLLRHLRNNEEFMKTYCYDRIHVKMGLSKGDYTLDLSYPVGMGEIETSERQIFFPDDKDNLHILVYDLEGNIITYPNQNLGQTKMQSDSAHRDIEYTVMRRNPKTLAEHNEAHPLDEWPKYKFPSRAETGNIGHFPFFPPKLVRKYREQAEIETLILTEGYLKAMAASLHDIDIVGLGSITMYRNPKTGELYSDIKNIIRECKVKRVIVLYDGDCRDLSRKNLAELKDSNRIVDLSTRPKTFMSNLTKITNDLLSLNSKLEVYFAYVDTYELYGEPKGLDDLLDDPYYKEKIQDIRTALVEEKVSSKYFRKLNLRAEKKNIPAEFHLTDAATFYARWKSKIGAKPFMFFGSTYVWNNDTNQLTHQVEEHLSNYIHVGNDFYFRTLRPDARNESGEYVLEPRSRTTVNDFFGADGIQKIVMERHYKGFVSFPGHINYRASIDNYYNLYKPIAWVPKEGDCSTILNFLRHLAPDKDKMVYVSRYGEEVVNNQYKLLLAYMWLLWHRPTVTLPILCLVSEERRTGKTSFLDLCQLIYGENVSITDNSQIQSEFNTLLSGKLLVGIDETALADNDKFTEKIKMWTTTKYMNIQSKGKDFVKVANYMKLVLCSNNETNFIYTDSQEVRFWVLKVPALPANEIIPNILDKFREEVPAFLAYLSSMRIEDLIVPEQEDRMWFAPERTHTDALDRVVEDSRSKLEKWIRKFIKDLFIDTGKDSVRYDVVTISEFARKKIKDTDDTKVSKIFKSFAKSGLAERPDPNANSVWVEDMLEKSDDGTYKVMDKKRCRPYVFYMKDWLDEDTAARVKAARDADKSKTEANRAFGAPSSDSQLSIPDSSSSDSDRPF